MLRRALSLIAFSTGLFVAGCNSSSDSQRANGASPGEDATGDQGIGELPSSVRSTRIFRCEPRGLFYVDFLTDDVTANLRRTPTDEPTVLRAAAPGEPFVAEQYSLSADGKSLEVRRSGQAPMNCVR